MSPIAPPPPPAPALPPSAPERFPLSRRELAIVAAVWAAYATLSIAGRLFDLGDRGIAQLGGTVGVAVVEALCWTVLTPPILALADRFDPDRPRARQVATFAAFGLVAAIAVGWLGTELRHALTPWLRGRGGGRGPGGRGGPPIWFGILNGIVLYLGVLAAGLARAYSRRYQLRRQQAAQREARLQAQLAEARLDALRRQLDPHFLFNTLNAVSALVERDPRGVRRMIARLSELLRHSFEGGDAAEVPLRQELALLARYVDIMQVRFQGRLAVTTDVDDDALDVLVPSMILQPLVENAIKHGVERATGATQVRIEGARDGGALRLRVRDDGPGPPDIAPPAGERRGVGVPNTVARLAQLYGDAGRFTLSRGPDGGAVAEIRLPDRARTPRDLALARGAADGR